MAQGENAEKYGNKVGKEWWGKRPLSNTSMSRNKGMKYWKRLLHKLERRQGKQQAQNGLQQKVYEALRINNLKQY